MHVCVRLCLRMCLRACVCVCLCVCACVCVWPADEARGDSPPLLRPDVALTARLQRRLGSYVTLVPLPADGTVLTRTGALGQQSTGHVVMDDSDKSVELLMQVSWSCVIKYTACSGLASWEY